MAPKSKALLLLPTAIDVAEYKSAFESIKLDFNTT